MGQRSQGARGRPVRPSHAQVIQEIFLDIAMMLKEALFQVKRVVWLMRAASTM